MCWKISEQSFPLFVSNTVKNVKNNFTVVYLYVYNVFRVHRSFWDVRQTLIATVVVFQLRKRLKFKLISSDIIHEIQMFFGAQESRQISNTWLALVNSIITYPYKRKTVNFAVYRSELWCRHNGPFSAWRTSPTSLRTAGP